MNHTDNQHSVNPDGPAQANEHAPTPTQAEAEKEAHHLVYGAGLKAKTKVQGFVDFIREQGVIGLAIGFLLGGAVSATVSSLVTNVINPLIGIVLGRVNLSDRVWIVGAATLNYGLFLTSLIDLFIVAAVVYFVFNGLKLDRLDKKKE